MENGPLQKSYIPEPKCLAWIDQMKGLVQDSKYVVDKYA